MHELMALLVTSGLLLLPLIPAAILYLVLSPKKAGGGHAQANRAKGEIGAGSVNIFGFRMQFNVIGSTATYVVIVAFATVIHGKLAQSYSEEAALQDQQAWLVEMPVLLKNHKDEVLPAANGELQQVRVELEPALTQASANQIQFWVMPNNGRFPSARFNLPNVGLRAAIIDLNDQTSIHYDYGARKMTGLAPVWMELGQAYAGINPGAPTDQR